MSIDHSTLIIDGDGVAIDFSAGFAAYMKATHNILPLAPEPAQFNYSDIYPHVEKPWVNIPAFIQSEFFRDTPFYPEAITALNHIHQQGVRILMVTSCGDEDAVKRARLSCIDKQVGGIIDDVIFLPLGGGKLEILSTLPKASFVDDQLALCIDGAKAGHQSYLFDRRYNRHVTLNDLQPYGIHRALSWHCLPHIGHDNAPRDPVERQALQILIEQQQQLQSTPLTAEQSARLATEALTHLSLSTQQVTSLMEYVQSPAGNVFQRPTVSQRPVDNTDLQSDTPTRTVSSARKR